MGSASKTVLLASAGTAASGSATSATVGPIRSARGARVIQVEAVDGRRIPAHHGRHLVGRDTAEGVAQRLPSVGSGPLQVRVIASPHDPVDADSVALGTFDRAKEAGTDVTLAGPVLAGAQGQRAGGGPGEAGDRRVRSPVTGRRHVERVEGRRYPPGALLGENQGEVRMAIECAAEDQVPQRPVRPPVRLVHPHRQGATPPVDRARSGVAAVVVDHQARLRTRRPERLPVLGVERGDAGAGGDPGQQHTAAQSQLGDLRHLGDGLIEIPEQDLAHPGASLRRQRAEVGQPAIVRTQAGPAQLELPGGLRWGRGQARLRKERRHGIGEKNLPGDAFPIQIRVAAIAVPVADGVGLDQVPEYGLTKVAAQSSKSSRYSGSRYGR